MRWHFIEGEAGCRFAREHRYVAIVIDALRASATATMLLEAGAREILAVREVGEAFAAKDDWPDALLFGERGGLPPEGFDYGNSPRNVTAARGRRVIFTTTTGAGRLVSCRGAREIYMGCPLNAGAVARAAESHSDDIVLVPAGLAGDPTFNAQEDWAAAVAIVMQQYDAELGEGREQFEIWKERIGVEGLGRLFDASPHARKLRNIGLEEDIAYCAQLNTTSCVPRVVRYHISGVVLAPITSI